MRGIAILSIIFLGGCGLSQNYRVESNRKASDLSLCQSLQNKDNYLKYLPQSYKSDLENEVSNRGLACNAILRAEENRLAVERVADEERSKKNASDFGKVIDKTIDILAGIGASQAQQQVQQSSNRNRTSFGVVCRKKYEWASGMNKNCSYDCIGSEAVQTVSITDICPISITR